LTIFLSEHALIKARKVSIPLRKFRKAALLRRQDTLLLVSIPLRKFRKLWGGRRLAHGLRVSIPLRKFRKDGVAKAREAHALRFHPSKEV